MATPLVAATLVIAASLAPAHADTAALTKEVAELRGLKPKRKLETESVDRAELHRRLVTLAADQKTRDALATEGRALACWGLIPRDTDYAALMVELLSADAAGYYDPKSKRLTLATDAPKDSIWTELVLAHEIAHGLQDQTFALQKLLDVPATEGDSALARRALVEGDGVGVMIELALSRQGMNPPWANPTIAVELDKAMAFTNGDALARAPLAVRETMLFPYRAGLAFVAARLRRDDWSAVDAAYKRPPRSTEQILHPEKYAADEKPTPVKLVRPDALADYSEVQSTVWGELGFSLFLRARGIPQETAETAAAGWDGDRVNTYAKDRSTVGIARIEWDTEVDAMEAHDAAVRAIDGTLMGATSDHTDTYTRWLALDGTVSFVERSGSTLSIAVGIPAPLAAKLTKPVSP